MTEELFVHGSEEAYLEKFRHFIDRHEIVAEIIDCGTHTLTVAQSAEAAGCPAEHILKTLLFHDGQAGAVNAIAAGHSRVDVPKLLSVSGLDSAHLAKPAEVLDFLGYPAGGVPPIGLPNEVPVVMDTNAAELETCYAGAGTTRHLVRLDPAVIVTLNQATVASITESHDYSGLQDA